MPPKVLVVIGASGVGKTATVRAIAARGLPGVSCFHFDSIGVPSPEIMAREFGGPERWQQDATQHWIARLVALDDGTRTAVLDGQTRPSFVQAALRSLSLNDDQVAVPRMDHWAIYLRGQADALNLPVVDTTDQTVDQVADAVLRCIPA